MASDSFTENSTSSVFTVTNGRKGVHLSLKGNFGGGTVEVLHYVNGSVYSLLNDEIPITFTGQADVLVNVVSGDRVEFRLSGATLPAIDFQLAGAEVV